MRVNVCGGVLRYVRASSRHCVLADAQGKQRKIDCLISIARHLLHDLDTHITLLMNTSYSVILSGMFRPGSPWAEMLLLFRSTNTEALFWASTTS